jgi:hypothetical protein
MTKVWTKLIDCSNTIIQEFKNSGEVLYDEASEKFPWTNLIFTSSKYRRGHVDIVDARETKNLWMMHVTVFPHFNDPSPIYGFDIIAGPNKISGAFHDFSKSGDPNHFMMKWFDQRVDSLNWKKERQLPEWAQQIFSPAMVAVGSVNTDDELDQVINMGISNLKYYIANVGISQESGMDYHMAQNRYCYYQKQNPHTPKVMTNLGYDDNLVSDFIQKVLFPETVSLGIT